MTPDTGLFTLNEPPFAEPVYQLYYEEGDNHHFFLRDIFVPVTLQLLRDPEPTQVGVPVNDYYRAQPFESYLDRNVLRGKGIYVDDFGNIVTNITREKFAEAVGDRNFVITLPGMRISRVHRTYDDVKFGSPLVLFNSHGRLEVAVNGGSAYKMLHPRDVGRQFDFNILVEIL